MLFMSLFLTVTGAEYIFSRYVGTVENVHKYCQYFHA